MSISRRFFLKQGSLTALTAGLVVGAGGMAFGQKGGQLSTTTASTEGIPYEAQKDPLFYYTRAAFDPCVGSVFQANGADGKVVELTLLSVTGYTPNPKTRLTTGKARPTDCFSLMFKASGKLPSFSSIPSLYHPVLGKLDMFLTYREVNGEIFYEAVINHLL